MQESIELRVVNEFAGLILPDTEGRMLGGGLTRQIELPSNDPRIAQIGEIQSELARTRNRSFFHGWEYHRCYSPEELAAAELFQLRITAFFEPEGTACGTTYDESAVCPRCGAGRRLAGDLILDAGKVPKGADFARTIAQDEWIVSERVAGLLREHGMTGAGFEPVRPFRKRRKGAPAWFRLDITAPPVEVAAPTRFGIDPFDDDPAGHYRCPAGHVAGLNILSELSIERGSWNGADIAVTRQAVGYRQGVLVPSPLIVVSPRLRRLLLEHDVKGFETEVAYLVGKALPLPVCAEIAKRGGLIAAKPRRYA